MTMNAGRYGGEVAESVKARDTRPDLRKTNVIINIQFREGNGLIGWKEYIDRDQWAAADHTERASLIAVVAESLLKSMESGE